MSIAGRTLEPWSLPQIGSRGGGKNNTYMMDGLPKRSRCKSQSVHVESVGRPITLPTSPHTWCLRSPNNLQRHNTMPILPHKTHSPIVHLHSGTVRPVGKNGDLLCDIYSWLFRNIYQSVAIPFHQSHAIHSSGGASIPIITIHQTTRSPSGYTHLGTSERTAS